jgi:hypothetical protein
MVCLSCDIRCGRHEPIKVGYADACHLSINVTCINDGVGPITHGLPVGGCYDTLRRRGGKEVVALDLVSFFLC